MRAGFCFSFFSALLLLLSGCSNKHKDNGNGKDSFLASVKVNTVRIEPKDSIDLEQFGWLMPISFVRANGRFVVSTGMRDHCLSMITSDGQPLDLIRIGRGAGEMAQRPNMQFYDSKVICFDFSTKTLVSVDVEKSEQSGKAVLDTLNSFDASLGMIFDLMMADDCYVSTQGTNGGYWYVSRDVDGKIISGVPEIDFPEVKKMTESLRSSFHGSSVGTVSPNGKKVCWANVGASVISFSEIKSGVLTEVKRYSYDPPILMPDGQAYLPESPSCFESLDSNADQVYALFSGKSSSSSGVPSWECNHLIVYDWSGALLKHYYLSETALSIWVEDDTLYAVTTYPEAKILIYDLI